MNFGIKEALTKQRNFNSCLGCGVIVILSLLALFSAVPSSTSSNKTVTRDPPTITETDLGTELSEPTKESFLVTKVIDGDTVELETGQRVRYIGINTPEMTSECYAQEATNRNRELVEGKMVYLEKDISETDQFGRLLRYVYVDTLFVNDVLVRSGYAQVASYPPDIRYQGQFSLAQQEATNNGLGLWGNICNKPTCVYGAEVSRSCSQCNYASVVKTNGDCSQFSKLEYDISCTYLCEEEPEQISDDEIDDSIYNCNCSKTCSQMSSCEEALYQLNTCSCGKRDGDDDGVPCESICPGG